MKELAVLGIGSPFGDDQLGFDVVKLLQKDASLNSFKPHRLHLQYHDRPGMHLLELMRDTKTVFLIDAIITGAPLGTLHRFTNEQIQALPSALSSHALGIAEVFSIGAVLKELPEKVILFGIEIRETPCQFNISKQVLKSIDALLLRIKKEILTVLT